MSDILFISGYIALLALVLSLMGTGVAGSVIPGIPGHALILLGALIAELFLPGFTMSWYHWLAFILLGVAGMLGDNLFSLWGAKRFGSTTAGLIGCFAGIVIGLFFLPWGVLIAPFAGALLAELFVSRQTMQDSFKSGVGAIVGTLAGFLFKFAVAVVMVTYFIVLFTLQEH